MFIHSDNACNSIRLSVGQTREALVVIREAAAGDVTKQPLCGLSAEKGGWRGNAIVTMTTDFQTGQSQALPDGLQSEVKAEQRLHQTLSRRGKGRTGLKSATQLRSIPPGIVSTPTTHLQILHQVVHDSQSFWVFAVLHIHQ